MQKGSLVDSQRLRFDFAHFEALTREQLRAVERLVNEQIRANTPVQVELTDMDTARSGCDGAVRREVRRRGARADDGRGLFGRTLRRHPRAAHRRHRPVRITAETGIAAGVRRVEAVTGAGALELFDRLEEREERIAQLVKAGSDNVVEKVEQLVAANRQLEKDTGEAARTARQRQRQGSRSECDRRRRREGARHASRGRRCEEPAHHARSVEGQARACRGRAGGGRWGQGFAGGRYRRRARGAVARRRADGRNRTAGRRQGWWPGRHGAGWRHATRRRCPPRWSTLPDGCAMRLRRCGCEEFVDSLLYSGKLSL
jgi:hypothetical protein